MSASSSWLVQRWEARTQPGPGASRGVWIDVMPLEHDFGRKPAWSASDPGHAFRVAILDNKDERLTSAFYRVLPYHGGATFNVGINVEAAEHG